MPEEFPASRNNIPSLGLLALAISIGTYAFGQTKLLPLPTTTLGTVLLLGGGIQIMSGMHSRQNGSISATATMLPLGLFWLSLIGFEVFPGLGFGHPPGAVTMVAYLSMWGLFAAILFLGSFQQSRALQLVFATLMFCLLFLAMGKLRGNIVFLLIGGISGILCGLAAGYTGLAQLFNKWTGRPVFPIGLWQGQLDRDIDEQLTS
jgi:succinate-acetate transporter protein